MDNHVVELFEREPTIGFNRIVRSATNDTTNLGEPFARGITRDRNAFAYTGPTRQQTRNERATARDSTRRGERNPQHPYQTRLHTSLNAEESSVNPQTRRDANFGDRSVLYDWQFRGGKRKSRGKRTKKGKKANKKSVNKRKSAKKGRKSRKH